MPGCAAFRPIHGIPARYLPEEFRGVTRAGKRTIDLSLLKQKQPKNYLLDSGDVLSIYIEGVLGDRKLAQPVNIPLNNESAPSFGFPIPVRDDGTISLPLVGTIPVRGLTITELETRLKDAYTRNKQFLNPENDRILVSLQRPRNYRVLVIRQEAGAPQAAAPGQLNAGTLKRGTGHLVNLPAYKNDVLHALAQSGGLPGLDAENAIYIIRRNQTDDSWTPLPGSSLPNSSTAHPPQAARKKSGEKTVFRAQSTTWPTSSPLYETGYSEPVMRLPQDNLRTGTSFKFPDISHSDESRPQYASYSPPPAYSPPVNQPPVMPPLPADAMQFPPQFAPQMQSPHTPPGGWQPPAPLPQQPPPSMPYPEQPPFAGPGDGLLNSDSVDQLPTMTPEEFGWELNDTGLDGRRIVKIPVRLGPGETVDLKEQDILLEDGDIVFIESRDTEVFYTGGLLGGGQYTLPRDYDLNVLQAIAVATGQQGGGGGSSRGTTSMGGPSALNNDVSISASSLIILRYLPDGRMIPIEVDLYKAKSDVADQVIIQPGDYILLQYTKLEATGAFIERHLLEGALFGLAGAQLNQNRN